MRVLLREKWGHFCDTDKLIDDTRELLTKYRHKNTEEGVCSMLDKYFFNKSHLIEMFMKSDNYIGNMRICLDAELERRGNNNEVSNFCSTFPTCVEARDVFLKYTDEHGKTLNDYSRTGVGSFKARELHYGNIAERLVCNREERNKFDQDGATKESHEAFMRFNNIIRYFGISSASTLEEDVADCLTQ